jgi:hypothetical protein
MAANAGDPLGAWVCLCAQASNNAPQCSTISEEALFDAVEGKETRFTSGG